MTLAQESRAFIPGTTGWTARDLDDPAIERQWFAGRYEIVEGVLTVMPPAYFAGGESLFNLLYRLRAHLNEAGIRHRISMEVDVVVDETRVARSDAAVLLGDDAKRQALAVRRAGRPDPRRTRILVPPTLVIESLSPGHEAHDQRTKRRWYAGFGVRHYWLLDGYERTLECLVLRRGKYTTGAAGKMNDQVRPALFPGLVLRLKDLWPPESEE